jgi:hypothetical protein
MATQGPNSLDLTEQLISPTHLSSVSANYDSSDLDRSTSQKYAHVSSQEVDTNRVKDRLSERRKSNPTVPRSKVSGRERAHLLK